MSRMTKNATQNDPTGKRFLALSPRRMASAARKRVADQRVSDEGADVLVVALLVLPAVIMAIGFALDITKNTYLANSYETMAQTAADAASNERNIKGELTSESSGAFVAEYMRQRGSRQADNQTQSRETSSFRPEHCQSSDAADLSDISSTEGQVVFPYIRFDYASLRAQGGNFGGTTYTSMDGSRPSMGDYNPSGSYVMTVHVYDVGNNFFLGMVPSDDLHECQVFSSEVSATAVLDDEDLNR